MLSTDGTADGWEVNHCLDHLWHKKIEQNISSFMIY